MEELSIFVQVLIAIAAGIMTLGGAGAVIIKFYTWVHKPHADLETRVNKHDECLSNDNTRIGDLEKSNRLIIRGLMQLMTHEIEGNHVDQLTETRDAMEQFLINK